MAPIVVKQYNEPLTPLPAGVTSVMWVAPGAPATGTGADAANPKDLQAAIVAAPSTGRMIVMKSGKYRGIGADNTYVINKKIVFRAEPNAVSPPIIIGSRTLNPADFVVDTTAPVETPTWVYNNYNIVHSLDSTVTGGSNLTNGGNGLRVDPAFPQARNKQQIFVNTEYLVQVRTKAELRAPTATQPATFYVELETTTTPGRLWMTRDPGTPAQGKLIEATERKEGLGLNPAAAAGCRFYGIGFAHYATWPMEVLQRDVVFEKCSFQHNALIGFKVGEVNAVNIRLFDCKLNYNGMNGTHTGNTTNINFESCEFAYNNVANFNRAYGAGGLKVHGEEHQSIVPPVRAKIYHCDFHHNNALSIWVDSNSREVEMIANYIHDNDANGAQIEISQNNVFAGNLIVRNRVALNMTNTESNRIYNNTFSDNTISIRVHGGARSNPYAVPWPTNPLLTNVDPPAGGTREPVSPYTWETKTNQIHNNIYNGTASTNTVANHLTSETINSTASSVQISGMNNNAYYRSVSNKPTRWIMWNRTGSTLQNLPYTSLEGATGFKAENTGYETAGVERSGNGTTANPFFTVASLATGVPSQTAYLLINNTSNPAKGSGRALPADIASMLGLTAGVAVDMGCPPGVGLSLGGVVDPGPDPDPEPEPQPTLYTQEQVNVLIDAALEPVQQELAAANQSIGILEDQVVSRDAQIVTKNAQISTLTTTVATRDTTIVTLNSTIASKDQTIAQRTAEVAAKQTQLDAANTEIGRLNAIIAAGGSSSAELIAERDAAVAARNTALAQLATLQTSYNSLQNNFQLAVDEEVGATRDQFVADLNEIKTSVTQRSVIGYARVVLDQIDAKLLNYD